MNGLITVVAGMLLALHGAVLAQDADTAVDTDKSVAYVTAADSVDADLAAALQQLAEVRKQIAAEKPAAARETRELASELREKQRLAELARQDGDALEHELQMLGQRVQLWRDEASYIDSLLADFVKQRQAQISVASLQQTLDNGATSPLESAAEALAELRAAQLDGGRFFDGKALDRDGVAHDGTFVEVGPLSWFVSANDRNAGLVVEGRDLRPEIVSATASAAELRSLAAGENVRLAFDPTLGAALALAETEGGFLAHIRQGGLWIWPILLLAVIALVAAISKWLQIGRIRDMSPAVVRKVLDAVHAGDPKKARAALSDTCHPAAGLLRRGIEEADQPRDLVEEALYEEYVASHPRLQRGLPLIAIASATAPLLGLLGTVTGMIETFRRIKIFGTNDTNVIAGGISEALVTTEVGLIVAIPALIIHAILSRRVQGIRSAMEMTSLAFINGLEPSVADGAKQKEEPE